MEFETVLPQKFLEEIFQRIKQQTSVPSNKKIYFGEDEFPKGKQKKPCIVFGTFRCFKFFPSFVERDSINSDGWDVYVIGNMKRSSNSRVEIIACFSIIEPGTYRLLKHYILEGSDSGECLLVLNSFIVKYAKKFRVEFQDTGMQDIISFKKK